MHLNRTGRDKCGDQPHRPALHTTRRERGDDDAGSVMLPSGSGRYARAHLRETGHNHQGEIGFDGIKFEARPDSFDDDGIYFNFLNAFLCSFVFV